MSENKMAVIKTAKSDKLETIREQSQSEYQSANYAASGYNGSMTPASYFDHAYTERIPIEVDYQLTENCTSCHSRMLADQRDMIGEGRMIL